MAPSLFFAAGSDRWSIIRSTPEEAQKQMLTRLGLGDYREPSEGERERDSLNWRWIFGCNFIKRDYVPS